jgi:YD repeat-containing protein
LDRLLSAQDDYGVLTYSYDSVGNRSPQNGLTYTYNTMNELLSISNGTQFACDDNENMLTRTDGTDTWVYTYDGMNHLLQVEKNQRILGEYVYDGDGKRIQKTEWAQMTKIEEKQIAC